MAIFSKLRCTNCGSTDFTFRHPSGRPRCTLCGTFAHGPEVARWRARRRLRNILLIAAAVLIVAGWLIYGG